MITARTNGILMRPGDHLQSLLDAKVRYEIVEITSEHLICKDCHGETRVVGWNWLNEAIQAGRLAHEPVRPTPAQPAEWGTW